MSKEEIIMTKEMEKTYSRRWLAFSVLALTVLIVVLDHMVLNVALPTLQRELRATLPQLQWIVDAYILAFASLLMTMGALGDRIGHTTMLRAGMSVFGLASLIGAFSGSAWQLTVARALMGVGGAMVVPCTLALISIIFPPQERGKAIGLWGAMNGLGVVLGPLLGGLLLEHFNWSSIFFINIPIVIVSLAAGMFLLPKTSPRVRRRIDLPGTAFSAAAVFLLVFSIIKANEVGWASPLVYVSFVSSFLFGFLFILHEKNTDAPMLDLTLFKTPALTAGSGSLAMMTFTMYGVLFALTLYLQFVKSYSPMETGLCFLPVAVGYALGNISSSGNVTRWGTKAVISAAFAGTALAVLLIAFWKVSTPFWLIGLNLGFMSFCHGNIMAPSLNSVLGSLPKERAGVGSAIGNISFQVGGALGVAVLGSVLGGIYRLGIDDVLMAAVGFPTQVIEGARESLGAAVILAGGLPVEIGQKLLELSRQSFMDAWLTAFPIVCMVGVIGLVFVLKFMSPHVYCVTKTK